MAQLGWELHAQIPEAGGGDGLEKSKVAFGQENPALASPAAAANEAPARCRIASPKFCVPI